MIEQHIRARISELDKQDKDAQDKGDLTKSLMLSSVKTELHDLLNFIIANRLIIKK